MAKERRSFTPEDKAKVLTYAAEHGVNVAAEHFNIVDSVIRRWQKKAVGPTGRPRKWTPDKIAQVVAYVKDHSIEETRKHFKISGSQISLWKRGLSSSHYPSSSKRKANGAHPVTNGLGTLPEKDALMWLERWRQAYFDRVKAETPLANDVLEALRGGK